MASSGRKGRVEVTLERLLNADSVAIRDSGLPRGLQEVGDVLCHSGWLRQRFRSDARVLIFP